jgi:hypothetical protein
VNRFLGLYAISTTPTVGIRVGLSHCDPDLCGVILSPRRRLELSNAGEGFWNPVSIESGEPVAIEMFGQVWSGRRYEFRIERMSFCSEPFSTLIMATTL